MLSPDSVSRHSFYPFIRIDTRDRRYRRPKNRKSGARKREIFVKKRPIDFSSHKDALVFSWYAAQLSERYEKILSEMNLSDAVIAYRSIKSPVTGRGKSNADFAGEVFAFIDAHAPCSVLAIDVSKFFEEIDHSKLKSKWSQIMGYERLPEDHYKVFRAVTNFTFVRKGRIRKFADEAMKKRRSRIFTAPEYKREVISKHLQEIHKESKGIPQGSPISCVLANMYMLDFDAAVATAVRKINGLYRRYSDDILIVCSPQNAAQIVNFVYEAIKEQALVIKKEKTERRDCIGTEERLAILNPETMKKATVQYLGIQTDGQKVYLRHAAIAKFQRRMNKAVKKSVKNAARKKRSGAPKKYLHTKYGVAKKNFLAYSRVVASKLSAPEVKEQIKTVKNARKLREKIRGKSRKVAFKNN